MNIMAVRMGRLLRGTPAELAIEGAIASLGLPYRFQFPGYIYGLRYFPDFALPTLGVVIEIDDPSHEKADKRLADAERDEAILREWGWRTVRIRNEKAISDPIGSLMAALADAGIGSRELTAAKGRLMSERLPRAKSAPAKARRAAAQSALRAARKRLG